MNPGSLTSEPECPLGTVPSPTGCSFSPLGEIAQMRAHIMKYKSDKSQDSPVNGEGGTGNGM